MTLTNVKQRVLWEHMNCTHWTHMGSILFYEIYVHSAVLDISISEFVHIYLSMFEASLISNYMFSCQNWIETSHPKLSLILFFAELVSPCQFRRCFGLFLLFSYYGDQLSLCGEIFQGCRTTMNISTFHTWKMLQYTLLFGCVQYVHLQSPWIHYIFA